MFRGMTLEQRDKLNKDVLAKTYAASTARMRNKTKKMVVWCTFWVDDVDLLIFEETDSAFFVTPPPSTMIYRTLFYVCDARLTKEQLRPLIHKYIVDTIEIKFKHEDMPRCVHNFTAISDKADFLADAQKQLKMEKTKKRSRRRGKKGPRRNKPSHEAAVLSDDDNLDVGTVEDLGVAPHLNIAGDGRKFWMIDMIEEVEKMRNSPDN